MVATRETDPRSGRRDEGKARDGLIVVAIFASLVALLVAVVGVGFGLRAVDEAEGATTTGAGGEPFTVDVELGDLFVKPSSIQVPAGSEVIVNVMNHGAMPHDLKLGGETGTPMIDPGGQVTASLGVVSESTEAWCTVPGHKEAGMVLAIEVAGGAAEGESATGAGPASGVASDDGAGGAVIDFSATAPEGFTPYDPTLQPAPGGTEHTITMRATETVIEVAPGVTQELWTFDDKVPGPVLRGKVGDLFTITLVNEGKMGHSIDLHASKVAWNDEMRTIEPGESLVYQFQAKYAGTYMYHCGTSPALHHIGNGMFGAIIVDPPELAPVDHEYVLVQSELYLGPEGQPGDLTKMQDEDFDAVVFNGYVNQYKDHPIRVEPGERVRVWVLDAGPSENSAFHIVGTVFDTVYKEGTYLLQPDDRQGGAQVLDLQPAQGGFVEFSFDEAGLYPIVTHKFANVGKGALGLFQAGDVEVTGGGH
ncbi:MAG: multicopper oxidase domain-containing protein [Acidimicrobiales bacterium]|jgi:nitrite reductase (NO-forming)|nr:multicopper oxidase domain-containing protein [Acidimicrobiales bacterium]